MDFRDYSCLDQYDKIACVGAIEHVPVDQLPHFFQHAKSLLRPGGLFLNHGITASHCDKHPAGPSFVDAFVFPDHAVTTIWRHLRAAEEAGLEIRDVECLREHYVRTCREWLCRLEANGREIAKQVNEATQRLFRIYVAAQGYYFSTGASSIYQTLLARSDSGPTEVPTTRASWYHGR